MKVRRIEEKHYFANRLDLLSKVEDWMRDNQIHHVWFTDRHWMKNDPQRYEVIIMWEEQ